MYLLPLASGSNSQMIQDNILHINTLIILFEQICSKRNAPPNSDGQGVHYRVSMRTTTLGTMWLFCGVLKPKQFFGLNRLATYRFQILHYQLGKKMKLILQHQKVIYVNGQVKRKLLELFLGQKMMSWGPLGAQIGPQGPTGGQKIVATSKNL